MQQKPIIYTVQKPFGESAEVPNITVMQAGRVVISINFEVRLGFQTKRTY